MAIYNRHRIFTDIKNSYNLNTKRWDGSGTLYENSNLEVEDYVYDHLYDVVTPHYRKRIRAGEIVMSPFHRRKESITGESGSMVATDTVTGVKTIRSGALGLGMVEIWSSRIPVLPSLAHSSQPEVEAMISSSRLKAMERIDQGEYEFGETLAEMNKTFVSLNKIFYEIKDVLLKLDKTVANLVNKGSTLVDAFSTAWLRARYEIRPLIITAQQLIEIHNEGIDAGIRSTSRSSEKKIFSEKDEFVDTDSTNTFTWEYEQRLAVTVNSGILYLDQDPQKGFLDELGLGLKDVIPTIWAVTRFSFLIDRFIDITGAINALQNNFDPSLKLLGAWTTIHQDQLEILRLKDIDQSDHVFTIAGGVRTRHVSDRMRIPYSPGFDDSIPDINWDVDWETLIDLFTIFRK